MVDSNTTKKVKRTASKATRKAKETIKNISENETFKVEGEKVLGKVKELIKEGNVRRIIIKDKKGKEIIQVPLTFGLLGAALAPMLAAVGAVAALVTECTITVERR
ncbi:DUF4342 domain-containing protein [Patescibacteria group bacterium]|nr:DUF4342 domain-containing protein [Patescibacteria group bacterium]